MTMLIELNDLRHAINRALNLGRYQIVVKTAGAEQVPASITLDLLERDDDEYAFPTDDKFREALDNAVNAAAGAAVRAAMDDHGAAIPEQGSFHRSAEIVGVEDGPDGPWAVRKGGPRVYEFTLQALNEAAARCGAGPFTLDSPNLLAEHLAWMGSGRDDAADWVHVYDRVTRERRTLKRPEPDAVLKGLRNVAADLRGDTVRAEMRTGEERYVERHMIDASNSGDPVMAAAFPGPLGAPVQPDPMPPVGPLTSTEGLKAGDVLRVTGVAPESDDFKAKMGDLVTVERIAQFPGFREILFEKGGPSWRAQRFAFVARPGVWMPWAGGENPVPGMVVKVRYDDHPESGPHPSGAIVWGRPWASHNPELNVSAYMVVDTPPASSDI